MSASPSLKTGEGIETSAETRAIFDAYIRGEIDARDLVKAYKEGRYKPR
jgi:hypothetical protein